MCGKKKKLSHLDLFEAELGSSSSRIRSLRLNGRLKVFQPFLNVHCPDGRLVQAGISYSGWISRKGIVTSVGQLKDGEAITSLKKALTFYWPYKKTDVVSFANQKNYTESSENEFCANLWSWDPILLSNVMIR